LGSTINANGIQPFAHSAAVLESLKEISMYAAVRTFGFLSVAVAICVGCGSKVQVSGTVKHDGQVVPGGRVVFTPASPDNKPAFGEIKEDGTFTMSTENPGDGVMVGQYRVSIAAQPGSTDPRTRTSYLGPRDKLLDVVAGENTFDINISEEEGWQSANADERD